MKPKKASEAAWKRVLVLWTAGFICLFVFLCGCNKKPGSGKAPAGGELSGTIRVSGAWALYPMMVLWGEEFQKLHPKVRIDISAGGAGKGVSDTLGGLVDIGMVSRDIKPVEEDKGAFGVLVVRDAVFPTMNTANPHILRIDSVGVKRGAFVQIWITGGITTWGQVTGTSDNHGINVYTRSDSCGAAETWAKYLDGKQEDLIGIGVYGDPGIAEAVRKDTYGIGFNNLGYAYDLKTGNPAPGLRIIPIDVNENGRLDPEEVLGTRTRAVQAVRSGAYPSPPARDLFIMTRGKPSGLSLQFARWILSDGQKFVDEAGYVKLMDEQISGALKKLEE